MLNKANVRYSIVDKTNHGNLIPVSFNGKLRDDQQKAAGAMLEYDTGVLSATTGFGKTVIASYLIASEKSTRLSLSIHKHFWHNGKNRWKRFYALTLLRRKHRKDVVVVPFGLQSVRLALKKIPCTEL